MRAFNMARYTLLIKREIRMMCTSVLETNHKVNLFTRKINEIMNWYEKVSGLDEVRHSQNRVLDEEKKLSMAQDRRREVHRELATLQTKLRDLYAELDSTTRGEEQYVRLITKEHRLLKEERHLNQQLQQYEREERDHFTALSSAVKDSHEKERAQAQRTKYWSIIGSVLGTFLGILGTSLNNHLKLKKFQQVVKESIESAKLGSDQIPQLLLQQQDKLNQIVLQIKAFDETGQEGNFMKKLMNRRNSDSAGKMDSMMSFMKQQQAVTDKNFKHLEDLIKTALNPPHVQPLQVKQHKPEDVLSLVSWVVSVGVVFLIYTCSR